MNKKSLQVALAEAQKASKEYPNVVIRVMDKKGGKAVYTGSEWVYKERVLAGYHTVATYKGGTVL